MSNPTPASIHIEGRTYFHSGALMAAARRIAERAAKAGRSIDLDEDGVAALIGEIHAIRSERPSTGSSSGANGGAGCAGVIGETTPAPQKPCEP